MSKSQQREQRTVFYAAARAERKSVAAGKVKKAQRKLSNQQVLRELVEGVQYL